MEKHLLEHREDLAQLQARGNDLLKTEEDANAQAAQSLAARAPAAGRQIQQILAQREHLREHYEALLKERDQEDDPDPGRSARPESGNWTVFAAWRKSWPRRCGKKWKSCARNPPAGAQQGPDQRRRLELF